MDFGQVGKRLDRVTRDYETHLRTFVDLLPTQTPMDLNFLLFRLDNRAFLSLTPQVGAASDGEQKKEMRRSGEEGDTRSPLY